jgi:SAM-dependent methyltransferase
MKRCVRCDARYAAEGWTCPACAWEPPEVDGFLAFAPDLAHEGDGFKEAYFDDLAALEANHFWFRARNRLILWALQRFFPRASSFLEVGCGTAFVLQGVHAARLDLTLIGSEIFTHGLGYAQRRLPGVTFYQIDARRMPFADDIDVIGAFDVIEHVDEDEQVLGELYQATAPGGGLLLTVPQHQWLWSAIDDYSLHRRRYSRRELVSKVRRAGFSQVWATSFVSLLLPVLLASRLRQPASSGEVDPTAELRISNLVNRVSERIMDLERVIIQRGLSLPAGGSLLLVARKEAR